MIVWQIINPRPGSHDSSFLIGTVKFLLNRAFAFSSDADILQGDRRSRIIDLSEVIDGFHDVIIKEYK